MLRDVNWSGTTFGTYTKPAQLSNRLEDQMQETPYGCSIYQGSKGGWLQGSILQEKYEFHI